MKINQTYEFDKFIPAVDNRDVRKVSKLVASMRKSGWIPAYPMHVVATNGKLTIKDGQHRFQAAKHINEAAKKKIIPATYVICDDADVSIAEINNAQTPWNLLDYLSSYVKQGRPDYIELADYCGRTGISPGNAAVILAGYHGKSGKLSQSLFKSGTFKVVDRAHGEKVGQIIVALSNVVKWSRNNHFVTCVSRCCRVKEFKSSLFIERATSNPHTLKLCATLDDFAQMIECVYNHRSRNPIPLKFLAENEMRKLTNNYVKDDPKQRTLHA